MKTALTYVVLLVLLVSAVALALLVGHGSLADPTLRSTLLGLRPRAWRSLAGGRGPGHCGAWSRRVPRSTWSARLSWEHRPGPAWAAVGHVGPGLRLASGQPGGQRRDGVALGCLVAPAFAAIVLSFCRERTGTLTLILTGFILSSLFLALSSFITSLAQDSWT